MKHLVERGLGRDLRVLSGKIYKSSRGGAEGGGELVLGEGEIKV